MDANKSKPNEFLRQQRLLHGWTQNQVADELYKLCGSKGGTRGDINANMISRWENGRNPPSLFWQSKLCELFGKSAEEMGFISSMLPTNPQVMTDMAQTRNERPNQAENISLEIKDKNRVMMHLEHLSFGRLQTTWMVVEGDGISQYLPKNIKTYFEKSLEGLPPDLAERKEQIERSQAMNRERGYPFQWNGQRYSLDRFVLSRDGTEEELALDLWFAPSDYYTFLATNMSLDDESLRRRYLQTADWSQPIPFFSNSFATHILVITSDRFALLTRRGQMLGSRPGEYNISVSEGLSKVDAGPTGAPSIYNCAERGLTEELGLQTLEDFSPGKVQFLSFGVDTRYSQWGLLGIVKVYKTAQEIMNYRKLGVKDKLENAQIYSLKFNPDEVVSFVLGSSPWAPGALACLYHALVHEFGRSRVEDAINRISEQGDLLK